MQKLEYITHLSITTGIRSSIERKDTIAYLPKGQKHGFLDKSTVVDIFEITTVSNKYPSYSGVRILLVPDEKGFNVKKLTVNQIQTLIWEVVIGNISPEEAYALDYYLKNLHRYNSEFDIYKRYSFVCETVITDVYKYEAPEFKSEEDEDVGYQVGIMRDEIYGGLK